MPTRKLGPRLREVRSLRGLSLRAVAHEAKISATYLQRLERGEIEEPSPRILHRLAAALQVAYADLMSLAGYAVPKGGGDPATNVLARALGVDSLTPEELEALALYLSWYRHRHAKPR